MIQFIATLLLILVFSVDAVLTVLSWRRTRRERSLYAKRLKSEHIRYIGFLKCHAHLFRIDRELEEEFAPFAEHSDFKPLAVGETFVRCKSHCREWRTCPVMKRLLDKLSPHELGDADGLRIIKSRVIHEDGTASFVLDKPADDEKIAVHGCAFDSPVKPGHVCYVRFDLPGCHYTTPHPGQMTA